LAASVTVEGVGATATPGDTLDINGAPVRPRNGQTTYVNQHLTLQAVDEPVFLGRIRATFNAGVLGAFALPACWMLAASREISHSNQKD